MPTYGNEGCMTEFLVSDTGAWTRSDFPGGIRMTHRRNGSPPKKRNGGYGNRFDFANAHGRGRGVIFTAGDAAAAKQVNHGPSKRKKERHRFNRRGRRGTQRLRLLGPQAISRDHIGLKMESLVGT